MDSLWSMSTTVREANRIYGFLNVAKKIEGEVWNKETQGKFQILLVQYREYLNDITNGQKRACFGYPQGIIHQNYAGSLVQMM